MPRRSIVAGIGLWALLTAHCWAAAVVFHALEEMAHAPVLATCEVEGIDRDIRATISARGFVLVTGRLKVLRSFPRSVLLEGEEIRLHYYELPNAESIQNAPALPYLKVGDVRVLPLQQNANPAAESWRLQKDEGYGIVIPAVRRSPPFASEVNSSMDFVLREVASSLSGGTRAEVFAEGLYLQSQNTSGYAADLARFMDQAVGADQDRWASIAAALAGSSVWPRPTIAQYLAGTQKTERPVRSGAVLELVLQRLGGSEEAKGRLIHQLLGYFDLGIATWDIGMTLQEFVQDPGLTRELDERLKAGRPNSLAIAHAMLIAGQKGIVPDALALAFRYIEGVGADQSEMQAACQIVRDFGSDEEFDRLAGDIRKYQRDFDTTRYDDLWGNSIALVPKTKRDMAIVNILLADDRIYTAGWQQCTYSDIARQTLARMQEAKPVVP